MKIKSLGNNKTEIELKDLVILISYETPVAAIRYNQFGDSSIQGAIKTNQYFSVTTSKHINMWLSDYGHNPKTVPTIDQDYFDTLLEDNK